MANTLSFLFKKKSPLGLCNKCLKEHCNCPPKQILFSPSQNIEKRIFAQPATPASAASSNGTLLFSRRSRVGRNAANRARRARMRRAALPALRRAAARRASLKAAGTKSRSTVGLAKDLVKLKDAGSRVTQLQKNLSGTRRRGAPKQKVKTLFSGSKGAARRRVSLSKARRAASSLLTQSAGGAQNIQPLIKGAALLGQNPDVVTQIKKNITGIKASKGVLGDFNKELELQTNLLDQFSEGDRVTFDAFFSRRSRRKRTTRSRGRDRSNRKAARGRKRKSVTVRRSPLARPRPAIRRRPSRGLNLPSRSQRISAAKKRAQARKAVRTTRAGRGGSGGQKTTSTSKSRQQRIKEAIARAKARKAARDSGALPIAPSQRDTRERLGRLTGQERVVQDVAARQQELIASQFGRTFQPAGAGNTVAGQPISVVVTNAPSGTNMEGQGTLAGASFEKQFPKQTQQLIKIGQDLTDLGKSTTMRSEEIQRIDKTLEERQKFNLGKLETIEGKLVDLGASLKDLSAKETKEDIEGAFKFPELPFDINLLVIVAAIGIGAIFILPRVLPKQ